VFRLKWEEGSDATLSGLEDSQAVVDSGWAESNDLAVGSRIRVTTPAAKQVGYEIAGTFDNQVGLTGDVVVSNESLVRDWNSREDAFVLVAGEPGADPARLVREAARVAPAIVVEVPLEANRSAARPAKRDEAARIGHVQRFDRAAIHALVRDAGLTVVAELTDPLPYAHHAFFAESRAARGRAAAKAALRRAAWRAAPEHAERLFTLHYACLARRR
jgi:hypothetical protein